MSDRDRYLKTPNENMGEFAAMTATWIPFHAARPEVSLTWFIQHYKDGELVADVQGWPAGAPVEPVPAPRLEWNDLEFNAIADGEPRWFVSETNGSVTAYWHSKSRDRARLKDKAEKLNALLSPPVGTQPEGN